MMSKKIEMNQEFLEKRVNFGYTCLAEMKAKFKIWSNLGSTCLERMEANFEKW